MENQTQQPTNNGQTNQKKAWYKKWWVIVLGILILYAIGSSSTPSIDEAKKKAEQAKQEQTQTAKKEEQPIVPVVPEKVAPAIVVTSVSLSKEYSENEVAGDAKYKGKLIEVSGKITSIDNGIMDNEIIIRLSDGKYDMNGTWCYMEASEKEKAINLKKGQQVTLIGTGDSATMGSPVLKKCTIK